MKMARIGYDIAYISFLLATTPQLMILIAEYIIIPRLANPEHGVAFVWIGFALFLWSMVATGLGILLTLFYWHHWPLWLLAVLNLAHFAIFLGTSRASSVLLNIHCFAVIAICMRWFLVLRLKSLP
jgi:hypothetical protein